MNRAFCRTFDVEPRDVIGKSFTPSVVQSDLEQEQTDDDRATGSRRRRFVQEIETARGPRWFSWEEQSVRNSEDGAVETQRIGRDITEQRQIEKTLDEARRQAEAASKAKSRFLAVMSHEIRTPLGGIMGMTGLLEGTKLTAEQRTYATAVKDSAKSLLTIIDEILDFSKIEAGKVKLDHEPFQLDHLIQGVAELLGPRAWEKNLELAWDIDPSLPASVIGDEHRIRQILMNLLGNAIKFTSDGGVRLSVTAGENSGPKNSIAGQTMIRFAVIDTGIGLTDEQRERIFTEFEQADTTTTRRFGGTGLGLTISRRLARSMDGDITIISHRPTFDGATDEDTSGTSRASERGTTFALTLPLATSANATTLDEAWARSRTPSVVTCATTGRNVLIASSRTVEAAAMSQTLIASGHNVLRADPDEAIACIKAASLSAAPIDTVISDTSVDTELRLKICTRAQEHVDEQADYLALIVIESADRDQLSDLRDEGFAAYLMRPVRPASLLSQLAQSRSHGKSDCAHPTPQPKLTVVNSVEPPPSASDDLIEPRASNARVLLAEDNPINALLAKRILEDMGLEVVHVENGIEALNAVQQSVAGVAPAFDLVLMDLHMPEMDGIAACKEIRTLSGSPIPPIIALTANAFPEDRQRCLKAGMCDYLTKPFEREQLAAMIDQWCHGVEPEDRHGSLMELASIPIGW